MIIVPVFLLHALLIDVIRVRQAERETESAVRKGVRSAMSEFDTALQAYGLFGVDAEAVDKSGLFADMVGRNIAPSSSFQDLGMRLEQGSWKLTAMSTLANQSVFRRQVVEEMKYRAPAEFALELAGKFKKSGIADSLSGTASFAENGEKLEQLLEKRDQALNAAWDKSQAIMDQALLLHETYKSRITEIDELAGKIGIHTADKIRQSIREAEASIERMNDTLRSLGDSLTATKGRIADMAGHAETYASQLQTLYEEERSLEAEWSTAENELAALTKQKFEWEQLLADMVRYAALLQALKADIAIEAVRFAERADAAIEAIGIVQRLNDNVAAEKERLVRESQQQKGPAAEVWKHVLVYDLPYFSVYKTEAAKLSAIVQGLRQKIADTVLFTGEALARITEAVTELKRQADGFRAEQGAKEAARQAGNDDLAAKKAKQRTITEDALSGIRQATGSCGILPSDSGRSLYEKLEGGSAGGTVGLSHKYAAYNVQELARSNAVSTPVNAGQAQTQSIGWMRSFADMLSGVRDELYVNEFALTKFNFRTYGMNNGGTASSFERSEPSKHVLANQEAEYLLYGFDSCMANIAAAYGEMYVMLLAIRTTEALLDPKNEALNVGSPLLVFLVALAEGAVEALADMSKLTEGKAVPIVRKISPVTIDYKEMLRVFLLIHRNETAVISRMQGLIELNTGKDLTRHAASLHATAEASMKLLFSPQLMKLVYAGGGTGCEPRGNRCGLVKTEVMSY